MNALYSAFAHRLIRYFLFILSLSQISIHAYSQADFPHTKITSDLPVSIQKKHWANY